MRLLSSPVPGETLGAEGATIEARRIIAIAQAEADKIRFTDILEFVAEAFAEIFDPIDLCWRANK
ncbi:MAG: hypothetical protein IIA44_10625 [Acidobacteria bacterium]|nr:hypothetical protein [Acidobacteriota bacterium]